MIEKGTVALNEAAWILLKRQVENQKPSKVFVIVDENIEKHCLPLFAQHFDSLARYSLLRVPVGEKHKDIGTCLSLWEQLSAEGADKNSLIINLGGGVITDMGGFVAATFKRGIPFVNIPTTLLAMVDASVGGKTGIDFNHVKNQIGTITLPEMVVIDSKFLETLPERQLLSGFAEMIKHALIKGTAAWKALNEVELSEIRSKKEILWESIQVKREIVALDPFEKNQRKLLNFGHTLGHAIESHLLSTPGKTALLHGEAIAIGMILEMYLSHEVCGLSKSTLDTVTQSILNHYPKQEFTLEDIENITRLMIFDKKNESGKILFVLMSDFGAFRINQTVDNSLITKAFNFYKDF